MHRLHLHPAEIQSQCEPNHLQLSHVHMYTCTPALTCFPPPDEISRYRLHVNTSCKWCVKSIPTIWHCTSIMLGDRLKNRVVNNVAVETKISRLSFHSMAQTHNTPCPRLLDPLCLVSNHIFQTQRPSWFHCNAFCKNFLISTPKPRYSSDIP